jgi:hypothetical protein
MKKLALVFILLLYGVIGSSQILEKDYSFSYSRIAPLSKMANYIPYGNGIGMDAMFRPVNSRFAVGIDIGLNIYGTDKERQYYTFEDEIKADMDIVVNNNISNFSVVGRYFLRESGPVIPFVQGRLGHSRFATRLTIYDPDDSDHCAPIDTEVLLKDGTLLRGIGVGVQWAFSEAFVLNVSADMLMGGSLRYMSVDGPGSHGHHHSTGNEVEARFLHIPTQVVHRHHVGHVYHSTLRALDFRFGLAYRVK